MSGFSSLADRIEEQAKKAEQKSAGMWIDDIRPPNFDQFIISEEYLGQMPLSERQLDLIRDSVGITPEEVLSKEKEITTLIALWSKGSGKGLIVSYFSSWFTYVLLSLNDFYKEFTFARGENVDIITVAPTAYQARNIVFAKMKDRFSRPCFDKFGIVIGRNTIRFDKSPLNVRVSSLTADSSLEGYNVILFIMDESSSYKPRSPTKNADYIYNVLQSSARTRFKTRWIGLCISYPREHDDFTMRMYEIAKFDTSMFAMREVIWNLMPWYSPKDFEGDRLRDPEFYACSVLCAPPKGIGKFMSLDSEAYQVFRSYTVPQKVVWHNIPITRELERREPQIVKQEEVNDAGDIVIGADGSPNIIEVKRDFTVTKTLKYVGIDIDHISEDIISGVRYFGHGDPGNKKDHFTFVIGHSTPNTVKVTSDSELYKLEDDGTVELNSVVIDAILVWRPDVKNNIEVDFINVRDVILSLHQTFNFNYVTFDQWNSVMMIQSLIDAGINTEDITFSRKQQLDIYLNTKNMIAAGGLTTVDDEKQFTEFAELQLIDGKIDHPVGGSKDIADCVATVAWHGSGAQDQIGPDPGGGTKAGASSSSNYRDGALSTKQLRSGDTLVKRRGNYRPT